MPSNGGNSIALNVYIIDVFSLTVDHDASADAKVVFQWAREIANER